MAGFGHARHCVGWRVTVSRLVLHCVASRRGVASRSVTSPAVRRRFARVALGHARHCVGWARRCASAARFIASRASPSRRGRHSGSAERALSAAVPKGLADLSRPGLGRNMLNGRLRVAPSGPRRRECARQHCQGCVKPGRRAEPASRTAQRRVPLAVGPSLATVDFVVVGLTVGTRTRASRVARFSRVSRTPRAPRRRTFAGDCGICRGRTDGRVIAHEAMVSELRIVRSGEWERCGRATEAPATAVVPKVGAPRRAGL